MKIDKELIDQLKQIFSPMQQSVLLLVKGDEGSEAHKEMLEFMDSFASCSPAIETRSENTPTEEGAPVTEIWRDGNPTGVAFCGIPSGHEFSTLILAVLNSAGLGKNLPDPMLRKKIESISGPVEIFTFVSLSCTNCPDVAQALNIVALLNPGVSNRVIDGSVVPGMVQVYSIQSVPTVYANGELLSVGRSSLGELTGLLEKKFGTLATDTVTDGTPLGFDVVVAGGGPAGSAAAIYLARKGLKVAVVAKTIGGQVKETGDIENLISVPLTTGTRLSTDLRRHIDAYGIAVFENRSIVDSDLEADPKVLVADTGERFQAPQVVIATGAGWRRLNIPGEAEHIGRGVAFCTHCDGPFYAGKRVAVIGGGNSGIEAAIDLAAICTHVDVFEFLDSLKADTVLQEKVRSLDNVDIHLSSAATRIIGDSKSVSAISVKDRKSGDEKEYPVQGVFVQIGLTPNTAGLADKLELDKEGEIKIDERCNTSIKGVYAAGDVTSVPYKQIIVAMGEGAKAALTAFDQRMRGEA